jgi:hypothetical protein
MNEQKKPIYEPNPKHKEPWQQGRRGSLCPSHIHSHAQVLLDKSILVGNKRYAIHEKMPYCAQEHAPGIWHGYPVEWHEIPPFIRHRWLDQKEISRRDLKRRK